LILGIESDPCAFAGDDIEHGDCGALDQVGLVRRESVWGMGSSDEPFAVKLAGVRPMVVGAGECRIVGVAGLLIAIVTATTATAAAATAPNPATV
jgi:hypothetical protein